MNPAEEKLKQYIADHQIAAEHLTFTESCHSVAEAAAAVGGVPADFVKNICLMSDSGEFVVAILKGEDRLDKEKLKAILGAASVRMATPEELLEKTGYSAGGVPSFGYAARFFVDQRVLERESVYSGGGDDHSLVKMASQVLLQTNGGAVVDIRKAE